MSFPGDERTALANLLTGTEEVPGVGFTVLPYLPARLAPPQGVVVPGSPYFESGDTFGSLRVRLVAALAVVATNNESATQELDAAIDAAVVLLVNAKWGVSSVSDPYPLESGGATYLASDIACTRIIRL